VGNELFLDPLFLAMGRDPNELWETWVAAVAENAAITPPPAPPPLGFREMLSYSYSSLQEVRDAIDAMLALQAEDGVEAPKILLVESWELGDATTAELAAEIRAAGLVPAISVAPFPAGFDVTRTDDAAAVTDLVQGLVAEGWEILVLVDLEAAAVEAVRTEPMTGTFAYRTALELVRAAADDTWITARDAPLLPTVGLVDGFQVTPAHHELAGRVFTNGAWWWLDGGSVIRDSYDEPAEVDGRSVAAALAGGTWQVDVWIEQLANGLSSDLYAVSRSGARPLEPLAVVGTPGRWRFGSGEIALINLLDAPVTLPGPGGEELLTGATAEAGDRVLPPGAGEVWIPGAAPSRRRDQGGVGR
jgi:hypothetical protein